jgi:hypothetical protein
MRIEKAPSWYAMIWIAGDYRQAVQVCREFCRDLPSCVTVTPTAYVYTGGMEEGVCVRFFQYPRFPTETRELEAKARVLAEDLRVALCQSSYSIEFPHETEWTSNRAEDRPALS